MRERRSRRTWRLGLLLGALATAGGCDEEDACWEQCEMRFPPGSELAACQLDCAEREQTYSLTATGGAHGDDRAGAAGAEPLGCAGTHELGPGTTRRFVPGSRP